MNTMLDDFNKVIVGLFAFVILSLFGYRVYTGMQADDDAFDEALVWCAKHEQPEPCKASVEAHHDVCFDSNFSLFPGRGMSPTFQVHNYRACIEHGLVAAEK